MSRRKHKKQARAVSRFLRAVQVALTDQPPYCVSLTERTDDLQCQLVRIREAWEALPQGVRRAAGERPKEPHPKVGPLTSVPMSFRVHGVKHEVVIT
jgi:hypothetical protein